MTYCVWDVAGNYSPREITAHSPDDAAVAWIEKMVLEVPDMFEYLPTDVIVEHDGVQEAWTVGGEYDFSGSAWQPLDGVLEEE